MTLRQTIEEVLDGEAVGDWAFTEDDTHIVVRLQPGDHGVAALPIAPGAPGPRWDWDGNREAPTLSPSILHHSEPKWHGFLRAGKLEVC